MKGKPAFNRVEMVDKVYNQWKVLEFSHTANKISYYKCTCLMPECGKEFIVDGRNIRSGRSKCCVGCAAKKPRGPYKTGTKRCKYDIEGAKVRYLMIAYKKSAKKRGISFNLTFEEFAELIKGDCEYCGTAPNTTVNILKNHELSEEKVKQGVMTYNGIDRVDSSKGYKPGNVVPCCERCNKAKLEMTVEEFEDWIARVYKYLKLGDK